MPARWGRSPTTSTPSRSGPKAAGESLTKNLVAGADQAKTKVSALGAAYDEQRAKVEALGGTLAQLKAQREAAAAAQKSYTAALSSGERRRSFIQGDSAQRGAERRARASRRKGGQDPDRQHRRRAREVQGRSRPTTPSVRPTFRR